MPKHASPITIDYYSDVLCIWAWVAQPRLDELHRQWRDAVTVHHRYVDIFGDCRQKIPAQWGEQEGYRTFGAHVIQCAAPYAEVTVHPDVWCTTRPHSSMPAHVLLKAVAIAAGAEEAAHMALRIRRAFFCELEDVGNTSLLLDLADAEHIDVTEVLKALRDGRAMAALSGDLRSAAQLGIKGSPTWVLNEGRQVLFGNVGYRILSANIEELLKHPGAEASWC